MYKYSFCIYRKLVILTTTVAAKVIPMNYSILIIIQLEYLYFFIGTFYRTLSF